MGANFREKSKVAFRINFRDCMPAKKVAALRVHQCYGTVHSPSAICLQIEIKLATVPSLFTELWRGFLSTLVYEVILFTMTYGRLVSVKSCHVIARAETLPIHML